MYNSYSDAQAWMPALIGIIGIVIVVGLILAVVGYVIKGIFLGKIFKKAGLQSYIAWIPYYNTWKFFELGGYNGALSLLHLANIFSVGASFTALYSLSNSTMIQEGGSNTLINIILFAAAVIETLAAHEIGKKMNKNSGWYTALFFFLSPIWYIVMGIDKTPWFDAQGKPSLAKGTILGYAPVEETPAQEAEVVETVEKTEE